jgi:hypothetical protein
MKLSDALGMIKGGEKTASAAAPAATPSGSSSPSSDAGERLKQALKEATAPQAKTASQASPVEDLTKIAADLSKAEHEALVKEAQLYGAAVMDGFMARGAQYQEAAAKVAATQPTKTAAVAGGTSDFEKFAAENPELVKEAAELGFSATTQQLEKLAEAAYAKGWNDTVEQIHKAASESFVSGFKDTLAIIESAR